MPLQIIRQDIIKMEVDAIVNTTNREMHGYSGVDYAVHAAAGPHLDVECRKLAPIKKGEAVITGGYNLNSRYIFHVCGPVWTGGDMQEEQDLRSCYSSCLKAAVKLGCETLAFPLISSGIYGYPKELVMKTAVSVITEFLFEHELTVYLCVFDSKSFEISRQLFFDIEEYIDDVYVDKRMTFRFLSADESKPYSSKSRACGSVQQAKRQPVSDECSSLPIDLAGVIDNMDEGFADTLFRLIDEKGMTDVECYKRANVSRKTFSKIKCEVDYRPSKQTALAFAIALRLNLAETESFLKTAGLALSHSYKFDVIIEYFIMQKKYDVFEINEALFQFDQSLLGC